jgi:hypothetical protein
MKLLALLLTLLPISALADVESSLGKSPDGRFDLILTASSEKDYGRVTVRDLKSGKSTETDSGQGYGYFPSGDVEAVWKASSDAFAVTMRGTKRTWNTDVYIREGAAWEKLEFPSYVANILGRQGVFKGGRSFHEAFGGFQADNRFILFSHIEPDWQQQEQTAKETDWKPTTQTEWKIELEYYHRMRPNCSLVSIAPSTEKNSEQGGGGQPATRPESK